MTSYRWRTRHGKCIGGFVQVLSRVPLFATPWTAARRASLSITNSRSSPIVVQSPSHVQLFVIPWSAACELPCPSLCPWVCSNSCSLNRWCYPIISYSVVPFSSCPQSFPASESFPMSRLFTSGGQSIEALASILPMKIQDWFPLGLADLISLLAKGLLRVFSITTVWKHQFFGDQPSLWSSSHIPTWLLEKP